MMDNDHEWQARRHDTFLRWRVTSKSRPEVEHVVDLGANRGIGACSCEHFVFRLQPKIDQGCRIETATRCSHLLVARQAFTDTLIQFLQSKTIKDETTAEHD